MDILEVLIFLLAFVIRVVLLLYGDWQDTNLVVKYTDVDYLVFSEAAVFVNQGLSPYLRSTYRYTPLLAWLMLPNSYISKSFGKWLFVVSDILIGVLLSKVLSDLMKKQKLCANLRIFNFVISKKVILIAVWLLNPIAINVSTRGNAEALISLLVLFTLYLLLKGQFFLSAVFFGLSVHFKIYPIIYSLAMYLYIDHQSDKPLFHQFFTKKRLLFTFVSMFTFIGITAFMYQLYGFEFMWETYLYHVVRKDHRHNFSPYFYFIYLTTNPSIINSLLSFLPQLLLLITFSIKYYRDLPFCLFLQTFTFVIFNKVCTVQYFIWYFSLLPIALLSCSLSVFKGAIMIVYWFISQGLWLYNAYKLEFLGENTFFKVWLSSIFFFMVNIWILSNFVSSFQTITNTRIGNQSNGKKRK